jgi:RNA polymerase-binding transcription factor DksA
MHYHYFTLEQRNSLEQVMSGLPETERKALHEPDYGVCESCGADIPFVRLLAEPLSRLCPACKS